ncbi:MAG: FixH family protein [Thermoguttaceae bacterium]
MSNTIDESPTPTTAEEPARPSRHLFWPIFLTSLISIHIVSVVVMVIVATHDRSFAIEPDWYQKGLHYEQSAQQQRENRRLGWSVLLNVSQPLTGTNRRNVSCTVFDRAGKPVENATVDLVAFAHLRGSNRTSSVLLPHGGGAYAATLAFEDPGVWEFRLVITRRLETFTRIVRREI